MHETAQRLYEAAKRLKNIEGQSALARFLDETPQTVKNWETRGVSKQGMIKAEQLIGCSVNWLKSGVLFFDHIESKTIKIGSPLQGNVEHGPILRGKVPLISSIQAGLWCEAIDNFHVGDHETLLDCPKKCGVNTYALRVKGDSMTNPIPGGKTYPEGTIIFVDPSQAITSGCRVIAKLPYSNEATFKEYREEDGKRWLKPLNPTYDKIEVTEDIKICGVVIGKWEDD